MNKILHNIGSARLLDPTDRYQSTSLSSSSADLFNTINPKSLPVDELKP